MILVFIFSFNYFIIFIVKLYPLLNLILRSQIFPTHLNLPPIKTLTLLHNTSAYYNECLVNSIALFFLFFSIMSHNCLDVQDQVPKQVHLKALFEESPIKLLRSTISSSYNLKEKMLSYSEVPLNIHFITFLIQIGRVYLAPFSRL